MGSDASWNESIAECQQCTLSRLVAHGSGMFLAVTTNLVQTSDIHLHKYDTSAIYQEHNIYIILSKYLHIFLIYDFWFFWFYWFFDFFGILRIFFIFFFLVYIYFYILRWSHSLFNWPAPGPKYWHQIQLLAILGEKILNAI